MLSDADTVEDYLSSLEEDWRKEKLLEIRTLLLKSAPHLVEEIHYRMLGYQDDEGFLCHLNVQRGYVSFYVGTIEKVDPSGSLLADFSFGKGCIRFRKNSAVTGSGFAEFLSRLLRLRADGVDLDC